MPQAGADGRGGPGGGGPGDEPGGALPAAAWAVRPGGAITAAVSKTAPAGTKNGGTPHCTSSVSGTLKRGSGLPGNGIGPVSTAAYDYAMPITAPRLTPRGLPWP